MRGKAKESPTLVAAGFSDTPQRSLPLWDDEQIAQEDWGAVLMAGPAVGDGKSGVSATLAALGVTAGATASGKDGGKSGRPNKEAAASGALVGGSTGAAAGTGHVDAEGRAGLESYIDACLGIGADHDAPGSHAPAEGAWDEALEKESASTNPPPVMWQRPADIVKPFRPVVHQNATPFLSPYASRDGLQPFNAALEEARYQVEASGTTAAGATGGGSTARGGKASRSSSAVPVAHGGKDADGAKLGPGPWHKLYPETVSSMKDLVGQDASAWVDLTCDEAIARYRELPALMEPYKPDLVVGCAETPAEACQSRYSTALRHKLQQADALAALKDIPPFLMSAFNSALLVVEQSQHLVRPGDYLWELIYPHAPGTCHPVYNPHGKYAVKLYIDGAYRKVVVDDALPVDPLGRPLLSVTARKELWPAILAKALIKALGSGAKQSLTSGPDTIITCLMGDWVPQYLSPRHAPVAVSALLTTYQAQLEARRAERAREARAAPLVSTDPAGGSRSPRGTPPLGQVGGADENALNEGSAPSVRRAASRSGSVRAQGRAASLQRKTKAKEVAEDKDGGAGLLAEEHCQPSDEEPMEKRPLLVCGLRTQHKAGANRSAPAAYTQLYTVTDVATFRNTLAIHVVTTPKCELEPGVFDRERDAKDVQDVLTRPSHVSSERTRAFAEKASSVGSTWLTFEELTAAMDSVVVWRNFEQRYLHSATLDSTNTSMVPIDPGAIGPAVLATPAADAPTTTNSKAHGKAAPNSTEAAASTTVEAAPVVIRGTTWISITSAATEEIALVVASPAPPAPVKALSAGPGGVTGAQSSQAARAAGDDGGTAPASATAGGGKAAAKTGKQNAAGKADKAGKGKGGGTGTQMGQEQPPTTTTTTREDAGGDLEPDLMMSPRTFATVSNSSGRTPAQGRLTPDPCGVSRGEKRYVCFEYYTWDRAEPLSDAFTVPYECGKTTSHVFRLCPGTHLYKVTMPQMHVADKITFYCGVPLTIRCDLLELLRTKKENGAALFHVVSDAGVHGAVEGARDEMVWFKRCLNVREETRLTVTLSTLLPTEDVSAYRFCAPTTQGFPGLVGGSSTTAAPSGKSAQKGNAGSQKAMAGVGSNGAGKDGEEQLDHRICTVSILKHTRLLLVDLDRYSQQNGASPAATAQTTPPNPTLPAAPLNEVAEAGEQEGVERGAAASASHPPILTGPAGRLPMITLHPNTRGYLLMAYTSIPASAVDTIKASFLHTTSAEGDANSPPQIGGEGEGEMEGTVSRTGSKEALPLVSCQSDTPPPLATDALYGKGLWNLTVRSNHELQRFEAVPSHHQVVPFSGSLRRGGASATSLFRYDITVTAPTHFSLLFTVREGMPIPFDLTIKRCPPQGHRSAQNSLTTASTAHSQDGGAVDDGTESAVGEARGGEVVFAATDFSRHAFVPDILLAPANAPRLGPLPTRQQERGGAGATAASALPLGAAATFTVEATVPAKVAAEWDELCRLTQEEAFQEKRDAAIRTVAAKHAREMEEIANDKNAFIARKLEELEAQVAREGLSGMGGPNGNEPLAGSREVPNSVHGTGATTGSSGGGGSGGGRRNRSLDKKKGSGTATASSASGPGPGAQRRSSRSSVVSSLTAAEGRSTRGASITTDAESASLVGTAPGGASAAQTDSTPEELAVTFHGTFFLSSAKAEVKNALPDEDSVAQLRAIWKGFTFDGAPAEDKAGGGAAGVSSQGGSTGTGGGGAKSAKASLAAAQQQQQQQQQQQVTEVEQRGERRKGSRHVFLANPLGVLKPHFQSRGTHEPSPVPPQGGREVVTSSRGRATSPTRSGAGSAKDAGSGNSSTRREHSKGNASAEAKGAAGQDNCVLIWEDSEEGNYSYAAPLTPRRHCVKLLPLWDGEVSAASAEFAATGPSHSQPQQSQQPQQQQQQQTPASGSQGKSERDGMHSSAGKRGVGNTANPSGTRSTSATANNQGHAGRSNDRYMSVGAGGGGGANDGVSGGGSSVSLAEFLQREAAERDRAVLRELVHEPLACHNVAVSEMVQSVHDGLRETHARTAAAVAKYWEAQAEAQRLMPLEGTEAATATATTTAAASVANR